jgi:type I restriction enzyme M protein
MNNLDFNKDAIELIDSLKGICASNGLGGDGNEYKVITQTFLYKFLNDKFFNEIKDLIPSKNSQNIEKQVTDLSSKEFEKILNIMDPSSAKLKKKHFLSFLYNSQNNDKFADLFDETLRDIALYNRDIFSVKSGTEKIILFDELTKYIPNSSKRDNFSKAIINKLVNFSFNNYFGKGFDFFSTLFEYLIKDYNKDGGGKYAEYFTPHSVSKVIAEILIEKDIKNVTCFDPSAGSGTLLMNLAHKIGVNKCSIYSQDISLKSSNLLRLNLVLNNLIHSIQNIVQGNTLLEPFHKENKKTMKFDFIVSNPPFKLDFSDYRNNLATKENSERFWAGVPNIPKKAVDKMPIYLLFIQHILFTLSEKGKAAIIVPTGFITAQTGIAFKIRKFLVDNKILKGIIAMPSDIFATTGAHVSIIFIEKNTSLENVILMDASGLGKQIKEDNNQKTVLSEKDENLIIKTFRQKKQTDDFSVLVKFDQIIKKSYSLNPGLYFENKIIFENITTKEFKQRVDSNKDELTKLFKEAKSVEEDLLKSLKKLKL